MIEIQTSYKTMEKQNLLKIWVPTVACVLQPVPQLRNYVQ